MKTAFLVGRAGCWLACALAVGATDAEALALAATGAAIFLKQLGTTGTASPEQIRETLSGLPAG